MEIIARKATGTEIRVATGQTSVHTGKTDALGGRVIKHVLRGTGAAVVDRVAGEAGGV